MRKKLLALLLAAALALSLLAGCGGGESVASALLKLLDGRYPNISIEIDPELEADLRQAIRKAEAENAGDDDAVIRAALETALGSTITFRKLGEGQQGDTTFDLVFYSGTDPDKAAQAAYSQWNPILSNVPADGQYDTSLAMVETNSGIWMLVKATVEKAGTVDKPDTDDDEPEQQEPKDPYTDNGNNSYTVNTKDGLQELFVDKGTAAASANITLESPVTLGASWPETITFSGELNGNGNTITMKEVRAQGLFNTNNGTVQDVDIQVDGTINGSGPIIVYYYVGAVAGINNGNIQNCDVTISNDISGSDYVGAVAGTNYGTIENCHVAGTSMIESISWGDVGGIAGRNYQIIQGCSASVQVQDGTYTGGVVGDNTGTVTACYSTGAVTGSYAGGVVGENSNGGTITACYSTGEVSGNITGGVVGWNYSGGKVTACYSTGEVSGNITGGVVGWNYSGGKVTACYSTGAVTGGDGTGGVVGQNYGGTVTACYSTSAVNGTNADAGGVVGKNLSRGKVTACYSTGDVTGVDAGGVVGYNENGSNVTACYWSGQVSSGHGIGYDDYYSKPTNDNANPVTGSWTDIAEAMNDAIPDDCPYQWDLSGLHLVPKS